MKVTKERIIEILEETRDYCGQTVVNVWLDDGSYIVEATGNHRHERPYHHFIPFEAWYQEREEDDDLDEIWNIYIEDQVDGFFAVQEYYSKK